MIVKPADRQPKPLMKVPEVAALFEVDPETVRVWARTGKLRSRRNPGGRVLVFLRADVEALLQESQEPPDQGSYHMPSDQNICIVCVEPTDNTQQARIGDKSGPVCLDCAQWCDGNLIESFFGENTHDQL
ncbi:helix-turn-helix domain-containing protein [Nonomuraea turcica]|uniref:helix-turn-helix domain-containing protein n=1 Tax=Nonomuraea sp. G32 TaxID=3067274 RepID=UPI00353053DA